MATIAAASLTMVVPAAAAAAADPSAVCDEQNLWQWQDFGTIGSMGSCLYLTATNRYEVKTRTISKDSSRGFHGCVYANFHSLVTGELLQTSATQRYGVGAGRSRTDFWNGTPPVAPPIPGFPSYIYLFVHSRC